jgi:hypothetical protein
MDMRGRILMVLALVLLCPAGSNAQQPASQKSVPKVTGQWTGTWGPLFPKPAASPMKAAQMLLDCTVEHKDGVWQATFEGECGRPYKYTVKMEGRQAGDVVLFKGTTDLGEKDGGVYDWIGRATPEEFVGFYTSAKYTGTFRLTPKKEAGPKTAAQKEVDALQGTWCSSGSRKQVMNRGPG